MTLREIPGVDEGAGPGEEAGMSVESLGRNYVPGSMGFAEGFTTGALRSEMNRGGSFMTFSMTRAREIAERLGMDRIESIDAGLDGDWSINSCTIYDAEGWHDYDAYHGSMWATPIILVKFKDAPMEAYPAWEPRK